MTAPLRSHRGFTLIEVLVSLALMAMISTILIASLQVGGHTWQRVTRAAAGNEDVSQAEDFLRQRLASIYPYAGGASSTSGVLESDGLTLEFSALAPDSIADGMLRYRIGISSSGTLEVSSRRDRDGVPDPQSAEWVREPLLTHVAGMAVRFWLDTEGTQGRWADRWVDTAKLPRLIRIDVTLAPSDHRRWPPLYVEPRIDTNANCTFDVVSRQCRSGA